MSERLRAEYVGSVIDLQLWARRLHLFGANSCEPVRRFAVGFYQVYQAMDWVGTEEEYESNAAAATHIIAAAEGLGVPLEQCCRFKYLADIPFRKRDDRCFLYHLSKLQGQIVYATNHASIRRRSRFKKSIAAASLAVVFEELMCVIPHNKRVEAIYRAMETMTGEL